MALVAIAGSRSLPSQFVPLVTEVVKALTESGRRIVTGCAEGADCMALSAAMQLKHQALVFAIGDEHAKGFWKATMPYQCLFSPASEKVFLAGGPLKLSLATRLHNRTCKMIETVALSAPGAGLVAFFHTPMSRGTILACNEAVQWGLTVIAFACGFSPTKLPALVGRGSWTCIGKGVWSNAYRWDSAKFPYEELAATPMIFGRYAKYRPMSKGGRPIATLGELRKQPKQYAKVLARHANEPDDTPIRMKSMPPRRATFAEVPLSYLDWLSGQPWCDYGDFRIRLTQFLKHPITQQALDEERIGRDRDADDSDKPLFVVATQPPNVTYCKLESGMDDGKWHAHGPAEWIDPDEEDDKPKFRTPPLTYTTKGAWRMVLFLLERMENAQDGHELYELAQRVTDPLKQRLPPHIVTELRETFLRVRARFIAEALLPPGRELDAVLLAEAVEEDPKLLPIAEQEAPELLAAGQIIAALPNIKPARPDTLALKKSIRHRRSRKTRKRHPQAI